MGLVLLSTLVASADAGEPFHEVYTSNGVFADVDIVDGCTETTGHFFTATTDDGPLAAFVGVSTDICGATDEYGNTLSDGQIGYAFVDYKSNGLGLATVSGSLTTDVNNSHFSPLTFEFSLKFTGVGATIVEQMHSSWGTPGESSSLDFSTSRRRAAKVTGSITVNGEAIDLLSPFLGTGVSGSINVNH